MRKYWEKQWHMRGIRVLVVITGRTFFQRLFSLYPLRKKYASIHGFAATTATNG